MNRIDQIFHDLRGCRGKALMPFLTAGDPDVATTGALLAAMERAGAAVCELGFPFSDPIADGPVIQASMAYALEHGAGAGRIFEMVAAQRAKLRMGLVAMVSYSIVYKFGLEAFVRDAQTAGIDGFIFPDLPVEESATVRDCVAGRGLTCSFLIAPTTPQARVEQIARACTGFVYVLARAGLTGERMALPADLAQRVERIRGVTDLPIAVGFGISNAQQVREVVRLADAAIVGSAIMRKIAQAREKGPVVIAEEAERFVKDLASGLAT